MTTAGARAHGNESILAFLVALVLVGLAALVPQPRGVDAGYVLALPVLAVLVLAATSPRVGVALVVMTFTLFHLGVRVGPLLLPLADLAVLGLLVGQGVKLFTTEPRARPLFPLRVYAVFVGAAMVSALLSATPAAAVYYATRHYAFYGIAYLAALLPAARQLASTCLRGILVPVVPIILLSIGFSVYRILVLDDLWASRPLYAGPFGIQKALPVYLAILWPWIRLLRVQASTLSDRQSLHAVELGLFLAVVLGFSKTAWLLLLVAFLTIRTVERSWGFGYAQLRRRLLAFALVVPLVLGCLAAALTWLHLGSAVIRAVQWIASIEYWLQSPVWGNGPGTATNYLFESVAGFLFREGAAMSYTEPHGLPIKLLPEVGVVGFLLFCLFLLSMLVVIVRSLRTDDRARFLRNGACLAVVVAQIVHLFTAPDVFTPATWFLFAVALALVTDRPTDGDSAATRSA